MKVAVSLAAEIKLREAIAYYNAQCPGPGAQFHGEYEGAIERIRDFPEGWPKTSDRTRQCRIKRFPYAVIYQAQPKRITVVAVAHLHRVRHAGSNERRFRPRMAHKK